MQTTKRRQRQRAWSPLADRRYWEPPTYRPYQDWRIPRNQEISEILPGLYHAGNQPPEELLLRGVRAVFRLHEDYEVLHPRAADVLYCEWPIQDGRLPDTSRLWGYAERIGDLLDRQVPVLVQCQAGMNRSALLVGCVLALRTPLAGTAIVALIRERRDPKALSNPTFERYILGL